MKRTNLAFLAATVLAPSLLAAAPNAFDDAMNAVLGHYLKIQRSLAADTVEGVSAEAGAIMKALAQPNVVAPAYFKEQLKTLISAAKNLAEVAEIESARAQFKTMSQSMVVWAQKSKPAGIDAMYCPMARAQWLQPHGDTANPYYGKSMLKCGERVDATPKN